MFLEGLVNNMYLCHHHCITPSFIWLGCGTWSFLSHKDTHCLHHLHLNITREVVKSPPIIICIASLIIICYMCLYDRLGVFLESADIILILGYLHGTKGHKKVTNQKWAYSEWVRTLQSSPDVFSLFSIFIVLVHGRDLYNPGPSKWSILVFLLNSNSISSLRYYTFPELEIV